MLTHSGFLDRYDHADVNGWIARFDSYVVHDMREIPNVSFRIYKPKLLSTRRTYAN